MRELVDCLVPIRGGEITKRQRHGRARLHPPRVLQEAPDKAGPQARARAGEDGSLIGEGVILLRIAGPVALRATEFVCKQLSCCGEADISLKDQALVSGNDRFASRRARCPYAQEKREKESSSPAPKPAPEPSEAGDRNCLSGDHRIHPITKHTHFSTSGREVP